MILRGGAKETIGMTNYISNYVQGTVDLFVVDEPDVVMLLMFDLCTYDLEYVGVFEGEAKHAHTSRLAQEPHHGLHRGGMQQPALAGTTLPDHPTETWEEEQHGEEREHGMEEDIPEWALSQEQREAQRYKVHVMIGRSLRTDVASMVFKEETVRSVNTLKGRLSDMLGVSKERVLIFEESDVSAQVPDWHLTPQRVLAEDLLAAPAPVFDYINILSVEQQQEFIVKAHPDMNHVQFMIMLARVVNVPPGDLQLKDFRGRLWMYPESKHISTSATLTIRPQLH